MYFWTVQKFVFLAVATHLSIDLCSWDVLLDSAKICIFVGCSPFEHRFMFLGCAIGLCLNVFLSVAVHLSINVCAINVVANKGFF